MIALLYVVLWVVGMLAAGLAALFLLGFLIFLLMCREIGEPAARDYVRSLDDESPWEDDWF